MCAVNTTHFQIANAASCSIERSKIAKNPLQNNLRPSARFRAHISLSCRGNFPIFYLPIISIP